MRRSDTTDISLRRSKALLCALLLALAATASFGQARDTGAASGGGRIALVIGNAAYKDAPLANPSNDAADIAKALQDVGFKVILKRNANTRDMRQAIREFGAELRRAEVGLFYFAGHGLQVRGNNYLVPVGADIQSEADAEDLAIDANYALRTMEEAQVKVSIVILDACRNNPFTRGFRSVSRGLAQMSAATGSVIAFATAPGSVAADGKGRNGIYTKYLLASLAHPDTDILKVFQRTRAGVVKETGGKQTPWESTSLIGDFHFRTPATGVQPTLAAPADPSANDRALWDTVKDSKNPDELKAYLEQFPQGLFAGVAQSRLKALQSTQVAAVPPPTTTIQQAAPVGAIAAMSRGTVFRDCADCPEMVVIPTGSFTMGSPERETDRYPNEGPQHPVSIRQAFAAGKYEVSKAQFGRFVAESGHSVGGGCYWWTGSKFELDAAKSWRSPGYAQTENDPVACVSWEDAKAYTRWLSQKTGKTYRLLTEAEWEYAARAGTSTAYSFGDTITTQQANHSNTLERTVPVGSYPANAFGLHDMHGNVWEWTQDCWNANYNGAPSDGSAWTAGDCGPRVLRGGSWVNSPRNLRSAVRFGGPVGYRIINSGVRVSRTQ